MRHHQSSLVSLGEVAMKTNGRRERVQLNLSYQNENGGETN